MGFIGIIGVCGQQLNTKRRPNDNCGAVEKYNCYCYPTLCPFRLNAKSASETTSGIIAEPLSPTCAHQLRTAHCDLTYTVCESKVVVVVVVSSECDR